MDKTGRNDPCPCGSGKKYKRCCLADVRLSGPFTVEERRSVLAKLGQFVRKELAGEEKKAFEQFYLRWNDRLAELGEEDSYWRVQSQSVYEMWFFLDFVLPSGGCVVDLFLRRNWRLSAGERRFLEGLRRTVMRLYEVEDVAPGLSVSLKDVLTGGRITVHERLGSRSMTRHSLVAARINDTGASGQPEIESDLMSIPELSGKSVVSQLSAYHERHRREHSDSDDADFGREMAPFFHDAWIRSILDPTFPESTDSDGERSLITRVRFGITDPAALEAVLDDVKEFRREDDGAAWCWVEANSKGEPTVMGFIQIEGETLELECMSAERGQRGRAMIEMAAGGMVRYRSTLHESLTMQLRDRLRAGEHGSNDAENAGELPLELQDALTQDHMSRYYQRWLDEPIPALSNQTPRTAAKHSELRPKLIDLIHELEGMYHRSLKTGHPAYDVSWMWIDLGLRNGDSPAHPPPLAHERLESFIPGVKVLCRTAAEQVRQRPGFDDRFTLIAEGEVRTNLDIHRFLRDHEQTGNEHETPASHAVRNLAAVVGILANFELHRRKIFWVDESLAYMLANTDIEVTGGDVRAPFPCFALVFTDRHTLSLAERMCAFDRKCPASGDFLQVVTVYVTEERTAEDRFLSMHFALDSVGADPPYLTVHKIPLSEHTLVSRFLENLAPRPVTDPPVQDSHPLRSLLHITVNAILYATSAGVAPDLRRHPEVPSRALPANAGPRVFSSDEVYFLPGKIDISRVRRLRELERVETGRRILHRFMVRGHWRRAAAKWADQRLRWIEPYWKGPDIAAVVERAYRLKP